MKFGIYIAVASALSLATPVFAQSAPEAAAAPKSGAKIFSSDGKLIGRIDRINKNKDGTPTTAAIIYQSRFIYIPVSTLSADEKGYASSLSRAEIVAGR